MDNKEKQNLENYLIAYDDAKGVVAKGEIFDQLVMHVVNLIEKGEKDGNN